MVALAKTALGRCLDTAGETVRTAAFKSNYVRLDVRNDGVPDPLAHLPANPDMTEVRKLIASFDPQVNACAAKHGVEGAREVFYFTIDGPTGTVMSVRGSYLSKAFKSCAEAIYKGAKFTKVRKAQYEMTYSLN